MSKKQPESGVIAERLRAAREQAGLNQGQVARLLEMHRPTIAEIEASSRQVGAEELVRFADLYGVSIDWITGQLPERADFTDERIVLAARDLNKLEPS